MSTKLGAMYL